MDIDPVQPGNSTVHGGIHTEGNAFFGSQFNAGVTFQSTTPPTFLADLKASNPRHDIRRILDSKDDLQPHLCEWILEDPAFREWWESDITQVLWIHGHPGKGKTMIAIFLVEELSRRLKSDATKGTLAYFFCQNSVSGLNDTISILKGLIFLLSNQHPDLAVCLRKVHDKQGSAAYSDHNAFYTLWDVLCEMFDNAENLRLCLLIDALDECQQDIDKLLKLVLKYQPARSSNIKWVFTSRNEPHIERIMRSTKPFDTSLEVNANYVSTAVSNFIDFGVDELAETKFYDYDMQILTRQFLHENAHGTFLWVWLVCKQLEEEEIPSSDMETLKAYPGKLEALYGVMLSRVERKHKKSLAEDIRKILCLVTASFRPRKVDELLPASNIPEKKYPNVRLLLRECGSFLVVQNDNTVTFVHHSAREFFESGQGSRIFISGISSEHMRISQQCLQVMSDNLRENMCSLNDHTIRRDYIEQTTIDKAFSASIKYACTFWVYHLIRSGEYLETVSSSSSHAVHEFLLTHLLHWLESMSLLGNIPGARSSMAILESLISSSVPDLKLLVQDVKKFMSHFHDFIAERPLQIYTSILAFSPHQSLVRKTFWNSDKDQYSDLNDGWSELQLIKEVEPEILWVNFSDNDTLLIMSDELNFEECDVYTGQIIQRGSLEGNRDDIISNMFQSTKLLVLDTRGHATVWDINPLRELRKLHLLPADEIKNFSKPISVSSDGQMLASTLLDDDFDESILAVWDLETAKLITSFGSGKGLPHQVCFVPHSNVLVILLLEDFTNREWHLQIWDVTTMVLQFSIRYKCTSITASFEVVADGSFIAFTSSEKSILLWDVKRATKSMDLDIDTVLAPRTGYFYEPDTFWSPSGKLFVAKIHQDGRDRTFLIDIETKQSRMIYDEGTFRCAFSKDERMVAMSVDDGPVRVWDIHTNQHIGDLVLRQPPAGDLQFSNNSEFLATQFCFHESSLRVWDVEAIHPHTAAPEPELFLTALADSCTKFLVAIRFNDSFIVQSRFVLGCKLQSQFSEHTVDLVAVCYSHTEDRVASLDRYGVLFIWNATSGKAHYKLQLQAFHSDRPLNRVEKLGFSKNDEILGVSWIENHGGMIDDFAEHWSTLTGDSIEPASFFDLLTDCPCDIDISSAFCISLNGLNLLWLPESFLLPTDAETSKRADAKGRTVAWITKFGLELVVIQFSAANPYPIENLAIIPSTHLLNLE